MTANLTATGPGDPSTFSFQDNTPAAPAPASPPDQAAQFLAEWNQAQQRYQAGVAAGYSPDDAESLYLTPVEDKYKILKSVPAQLQPQAQKELSAAQQAYVTGVNAGYSPEDASKLYLDPAQQKWVASADVKTPPAADPLIAHKVGALQEVEGGIDPQQVMQAHPQGMFADPKFVARFEAAAETAQKSKQKTKEDAGKAAAKDTPLAAIETLSRLANIQANKNFQASPETAQAIQKLADSEKSKLIGPPGAYVAAPPQTATGDLGGTPSGAGAKYLTKFKTAQDVGAAYRSNELTRAEAKKILADQFGIN